MSSIAKLIVFVIGGLTSIAGQVIAWGLVPAADKGWVSLVVGVLTLAGTGISVYFVPNTPTPTPPVAAPAVVAADAQKPAA